MKKLKPRRITCPNCKLKMENTIVAEGKTIICPDCDSLIYT